MSEQLLKLYARKNLLLSRKRENRNVVNKIDRQIRRLEGVTEQWLFLFDYYQKL